VILYEGHAGLSRNESFVLDASWLSKIQKALENEQYEEAAAIISDLTAAIKRHPNTLVNTVKDIYYQLLQLIEKYATLIGTSVQEDGRISLWHRVESVHYLVHVEHAILQSINKLCESVRSRPGSGMVARIIAYIQDNLDDNRLSVQAISDHLDLTASYIISMFKEATGQTIHQFITEHRIEQSKALLIRFDYKIADIAGRVGFTDGEQFTRTFRKVSGYTPSAYRERYRK
jgi:two-component system response regulator YesN